MDSLAGKVALGAGLTEAYEHPLIPGSSILVFGTRAGTLTVLEAVARGEPRVLLRTRMPDGLPIIGVGMLPVGRRLGRRHAAPRD